MEGANRHDLKINGSMSVSGGVYDKVLINGQADINGDLDCMELKTNGASSIKGNVKAGSVKINGSSKIEGKLEADEFKVSGSGKVGADAFVKYLKVDGGGKIEGNVSAEEVYVRGSIGIKGDCNAEQFHSKGAFDISGLLNAGIIEIDLYHKCKAREIGGEKINVRKSTDSKLKKFIKSILMPFDLYDDHLNVDTIEGDDIYLEYTNAKVVRGRDVRIGPGCEIDIVEYSGTFEQHSEARVTENKMV